MAFEKAHVLQDTARIYEGKFSRPLPTDVLNSTLDAAQAEYNQRGYDYMIVSVRTRLEELLEELDVSSTPDEAASYRAHEALLEALRKLQIQSN